MPDYGEWIDHDNRGNWRNESRTKSAPAWLVYLAAITSVLALGKTVFFSGTETGNMEAHLQYNDRRLDALEAQQQRDEAKMEPAIELMQETAVEDKQVAEEQREAMQQIQDQIRALRGGR